MPPEPGTSHLPLIDRLRQAVIGQYDVYAELGSGGMASVFLALDLALDRKVAIKVMFPELSENPDNVERFKREAKVSASLNHPNIIGIHTVGSAGGLAYFVMRFVEGRTLESVIREEGPQPVGFVQQILMSAGKALHHAHAKGVVHRDIKPANLMLDVDGWVIVTDFGIAKQVDAATLTSTGLVVGTPTYMAPEQVSGKPITPKADQYALGVVAYELLTGAQPYTGESIAEVLKGHLFDKVPRVRTSRPDVPRRMTEVIARMMAKDPRERYDSLEEAVAALGAMSPTTEAEVRTAIVDLAQVGASRQPRVDVPLSPVPTPRSAAETVIVRRPRRVRWGAVFALVFVVLGGAGAAVWFAPPLRPLRAYVEPTVAEARTTVQGWFPSLTAASAARADSLARADSIMRALLAQDDALRDSLVRDSLVHDSLAQTQADSASK